MTARLLVLYETPADPGASGLHYRETHIPLGRLAAQAAPVRGQP